MQQQIYQLRMRLKNISPMIWRRILVKSATTIADLHYIIQILMGWSDSYLHNFKIHGREYSVSQIGDVPFSSKHKVALSELTFFNNDIFIYKYNYFAGWEVEIRVENILADDVSKFYPVCIDGKRNGPLEDIRGPINFMKMEDYYCNWRIIELMQRDLKRCKSGHYDNADLEYSFDILHYWITKNAVKRRWLNKTLNLFSKHNPDWEERLVEESHYEI